MSQTLGEKLREAREERGISISEVAEQTRISSLYIDSIEKDNYKPLPGGIFNKGFVKSYAKFIGIDENEALQDYAQIVTETEGRADDELRKYKPEVLTDDNPSVSMVPTIIFAGIILALMTGGILFVVSYIQNQPEAQQTARTSNSSNTNTAPGVEPGPTDSAAIPEMASLKVEFRATTDAVSLRSITDGKNIEEMVAAGSSRTFEPKESLKLLYAKSRAQFAQLLINGKQIELPQAPKDSRRAAIIEIEINKDNLSGIWENGRISFDQPTPAPTAISTPEPDPTATRIEQPTPADDTPQPTPRPTPRPTTRPTTPRPTPRPATPEPLPTRRVIIIGNANRP